MNTLMFVLLAAALSEPDKYVARLVETLHLTPAQTEAANHYREVTDRHFPAFDRDAYNAKSTPQRYQYMADMAVEDAADVKRRAEAMTSFYDLLNPDQKAQYDRITAIPVTSSGVAADPVGRAEAVEFSRITARPPSFREPQWLIKPDGDIVARVYPKKAMEKNIAGRVRLECDTDLEGYLSDCTILEETPKEFGFANAALIATGYMRTMPALARGVPTYGKMRVALVFKLPE